MQVFQTKRTVLFMFERFTDLARRSVVLSQEACREMRHTEINPEHLLLGVTMVENGVGAQVLGKYGISTDVMHEYTKGLHPQKKSASDGHLPFSSDSKRALESALREALALGHNYIGTEHILLGLLRLSRPSLQSLFALHNTDSEALRDATLEFLAGSASDNVAASTRPTASEDQEKTARGSILETFGKNLTALAKTGKLDPVVGRKTEIERVTQVLSRRTKSNPCLIGEPGVGKTAVVEGLAQKIASGDVPKTLKDVQIYTIDLGSMVAGSRYRGDFEERMKKLIREMTTRTDVVVFLDEIHTLVGAGSAEGSIDASNMLKPALSRGEIRVIGATTFDEYRKHFEKDPALERRFQPVEVDEPSPEIALEIVTAMRARLEEHHECAIADESLEAAVKLSVRYLTDRRLPDKALDLLDEAGAFLRTHPDYETYTDDQDRKILSPNVVERVCAAWCKVPLERLSSDDAMRLLEMEAVLAERVVGQSESLKVVSRALRRSRSGLGDPKRPTGSFLFLGPTGVGKTEVAKALAEFMFGEEDRLISLDMSEYQEQHSISRLVGAPPGYVGHDESGQLTEAVRRNPYSVILFDEVEKAHPDVFNVLLQILEEGRLTDAKGRAVDFKNCIVVLTSNLGSDKSQRPAMGFTNPSAAAVRMDTEMREAAKKFFKPELLNRIDEIVVFSPLAHEEILGITGKFVDQVAKRLSEHKVSMTLSPAACDLLSVVGFDEKYGARPLRRAVQRLVEDPLSEQLLSGLLRAGDSVVVDAIGDEVVVRIETPDRDGTVSV